MRRQLFGEKLIPETGAWGKSPIRIAKVASVNAASGEVNLTWLDSEGGTTATYSLSDCGVYGPPTQNMVALVVLGPGNYPMILRYLPVGYADRVDKACIRQINPGEFFVESLTGAVDGAGTPIRTGTELYMTNAGDVYIATAFGDTWQIRRDDNLLFQRFANFELQTEAGRLFYGLVRRVVDGNTRLITQNSIPLAIGGRPLTELRIAITDTADNDPTTPPGADNPLVEVIAGNEIDGDGQVVRSESGNPVALRVRLRDDASTVTVDNQGNMTVEAKTLHFKTTSGSEFDIDTDDGGDTTITVKAGAAVNVKADNINLGNSTVERLVNELFMTAYNSHPHLGNLGFLTGPVLSPGIMAATHLTKDTKAG